MRLWRAGAKSRESKRCLNPISATYGNRGLVYNNKGEYDRAITDLDKAIQLDPKSATAHKDRGISYEKKSELQKALIDYNRAISLDSQYRLWHQESLKTFLNLSS